jgi:hypothetical protein
MHGMASHCALQISADICPMTSRSKSTGNVALYLIDVESTPDTERRQIHRCHLLHVAMNGRLEIQWQSAIAGLEE